MFTSKARLRAIFSLVICTFFSVSFSVSVSGQAGMAQWTLNADASSLYYVTNKAAAVSEMNSFTRLGGAIQADGSASVSIYLDSVDTAIDIRNERMRDIVFQVSNFPLATVTVNTDAAMLRSMDAGKSMRTMTDATIALSGAEQTVSIDVVITGLQDGGLLVSLARPLIINAASFGLADEVEQLREIAGLPSINNNVVVDFTLQFDAAN